MDDKHPLRAYREAQDPPISQQELAEKIGVQRETVTRWEGGTRKIEGEWLAKIRDTTGIHPRVLRPDLADLMEAAE